MDKASALGRIDKVIEKGQRTLDSVAPVPKVRSSVYIDPDSRWVEPDVAAAFRTAGLGVLADIFGTDHQLYKDFAAETTPDHRILSHYRRAHAIMQTVREDVEQSWATDVRSVESKSAEISRTAFLVHGHDDAARESVARYLEQLRIKPIILHEQPNQGRTVIEKLEHHADVTFAVVLLTPDDVGAEKQKAAELRERARQNVVLELGFFVGKLGRHRVCAIYKGAVELPSDYVGVVYVPFDDSGGWRLSLARELKAAGFAIDMNLAV